MGRLRRRPFEKHILYTHVGLYLFFDCADAEPEQPKVAPFLNLNHDKR